MVRHAFKYCAGSAWRHCAELRFKIDSFREDESRRLAEKERQLQQALDESNRALLTVKAERNNSRSRANSLSRELLQCEQANGKRMALISDLRLELAAQKGEIKVVFPFYL